MSSITISGVTGGTPPLTIYLCDEYGNNCYLISTTGGTYTLNSFYSSANTLMVKTVDSTGCEYFELVNCYVEPNCFEYSLSPYCSRVGSGASFTYVDCLTSIETTVVIGNCEPSIVVCSSVLPSVVGEGTIFIGSECS